MVLVRPYRQVLAVPRVPALMLVMFLARLPVTAAGISLTLYVVAGLGRGYGAAGLVGAAMTAGNAAGAPLLGRLVDRYGMRRVVAMTGTCSTAFWVGTHYLPYLVLLAVTLPAGMVAVPVSSLARQFLAAMVPEVDRRAAFSLDTILTEMSFMLGPATAVLVTTALSAPIALTGIGACFAAASIALYALNLPTRAAHERRPDPAHVRPPLREWLPGRPAATLLTATGALFTLIGTELAVLAALRANGELRWAGAVIAVMSAASIVGGAAYGAARRSPPPSRLMLMLGILAIPVGLFDKPWWLLAVALVPMNLLCTPTMTATAEAVSRLAPERVRGEAMGLLDSAVRLGIALGAPTAGIVVDHAAPAWGFVAAGLGGLVLAALGSLAGTGRPGAAQGRERARRRRPAAV